MKDEGPTPLMRVCRALPLVAPGRTFVTIGGLPCVPIDPGIPPFLASSAWFPANAPTLEPPPEPA